MAGEMQKKVKTKLSGEVVSSKMDKTIIVRVERTYADTRVHKIVRSSKKYKVHDESGLAKEGDIVQIYEGRPKSKDKYMYLDKVVSSRN